MELTGQRRSVADWVRLPVNKRHEQLSVIEEGPAVFTAAPVARPFEALGCSEIGSELVSLVYRNDDGVNASIEPTVFRVDVGDSIGSVPDNLAERGAETVTHFLRNLPSNRGAHSLPRQQNPDSDAAPEAIPLELFAKIAIDA